MSTRRAALTPALADAPPLLWLPGRSAVERHFRAAIRLRRPGELLLRAGWSSYAGADRVAGRPRLRGAAFAPDLSLIVR
ncbi:MAG: hypothetical protein IT372_05675 [Polyangiaceae bacterium]|nr:hypothetical protein [Polyangiaceae bacterium]